MSITTNTRALTTSIPGSSTCRSAGSQMFSRYRSVPDNPTADRPIAKIQQMTAIVKEVVLDADSGSVETGEPAATSPDDCPQCLLGNLNWLLAQAHYSLATELAAAFEPLGISPRGHAVLAAAMTGAHTQKELAELVGLDKTTMVVTLDELEEAGLAQRV